MTHRIQEADSTLPRPEAPDDLELDRQELTRSSLSAETERLREGFGLPIRLLPLPREGTRGALREYTLGLNRLISGQAARVWPLLARHLPPDCVPELEPLFKARFRPLWQREEMADLRARDARSLSEEWHRRIDADVYWGALSGALRDDQDFAAIWGSLSVGDFDVDGRGKDYTTGMEYFQAARSFGIETLLELFGDLGGRGSGTYLDVLGGDGYILRILQASRKMRETGLLVLPAATLALDAAEPGLDALRREILRRCGGPLVLLVTERGAETSSGARLVAVGAGELTLGEPFELAAAELDILHSERAVRWRVDEPPVTGFAALLARAVEVMGEILAADAGTGREPLMVTNDISPHMFRSAGLWGAPTREDARRLSRTFRPETFDGILFAYGSHHVSEIDAAIRQSFLVLRPGGRLVVHDFLDEGQVGRWFHEVVDKHSRTGHDFPHLGPVQLAVYAYLAGFRDVQLYEMEDPFVFAVPEAGGASARDVACTYLLGMYGMTESFGGQLDRFEPAVREFLTYPEIGNEPLFAQDLVYVPRRAVVVSARRPAEPGALTDGDRTLIPRIRELLAGDPADLLRRLEAPPEVARVWFPGDGTRWGLSIEHQRAWLDGFQALSAG
jgi:SAM-dependent methyltransferase